MTHATRRTFASVGAANAASEAMPSFWRGCLFALALAALSVIAYSFGAHWLAPRDALHLVVIGLGATYCGFLLAHRRRNTGIVSFAILWLVTTAITSYFSVEAQLAIQLTLFSLLRIFLFRRDTLNAVGDCILAVVCYFVWFLVAMQTGSLAITVWSVFLIQAAAPALGTRANNSEQQTDKFERSVERALQINTYRFDAAQRSAQRAIERLNCTL